MIESYSSGWPIKYTEEEARLKANLGDHITDIQHIGSTDIPGIHAKPIIDIMAAVHSLDAAAPLHPILEKLGYEYKPDMSSSERLFFRKGDPVEFHLSVAQPGHTSYWERQILFRDFLVAHPKYAKEYEQLKMEAIAEVSEDEKKDLSRSSTYSAKKGPFIQKILDLAQFAENKQPATLRF